MTPPNNDDVNPFINMRDEKPGDDGQNESVPPEESIESEVEAEPAENTTGESAEAGEPAETDEPAEPVEAASDGTTGERGLPEGDDGPREGEAPPVYVDGEPGPEKKKGSFSSTIKGMLSFFTIIPVDATEEDIEAMNDHFWLSPVIGLVFATFALVAFLIGNLGSVTLGIVAAYGTMLVLNKFLHMDGLMDTGDALVATGDIEKKRTAMKDVTVGAGGLAVGAFVMIATFFLFTNTTSFYDDETIGFLAFIMVAEVCARNSMVIVAAYGNASPGMAHDSVDRTSSNDAMMSIIMTTLFVLIIYVIAAFVFDQKFNASPPSEFWVGLFTSVIGSCLWGFLVPWYANKKLGGVTGDVLGFTVEAGRLAILAFMIFVTGIVFSI